MCTSCKSTRFALFALALCTAVLPFAMPELCMEALCDGLRLCGGPLLVSLFPFLIVSALLAQSGAGETLGSLMRPVLRMMGFDSNAAGAVLITGLLGGFAPAAVAASEQVRTGRLSPRQAGFLSIASLCMLWSFFCDLDSGRAVFGQPCIGDTALFITAAGRLSYCGTVLQAYGQISGDLLRSEKSASSSPSVGSFDRGICIALCSALRVCRIFPNVGGGNGRYFASCMGIFARNAAGSKFRLRSGFPHRAMGKPAVLCSSEPAGGIGAAASPLSLSG